MNVAIHPKELLGIELCSGYGGLGLGIKLAEPSYRTVCHVEREAYASAILAARMADKALAEAPIWSDLTTFDGKPWRGKVHIVSAGFPCQPWSAAGKKGGIKDERWLWPHIDGVIRDTRPEYVFVENVPGLLNGGIQYVLTDLAKLGFVAEWDVFSAAAIGAPHERARLFILAYNNQAWKPQLQGMLENQRGRNYNGAKKSAASDYGKERIPRLSQESNLRFSIFSWCENVRGPEDLRNRPDIPEPLLWGNRNGYPFYVDRISALGNGVIPAVAARAWRELGRRLLE
jgi:DNA (cytosine-5)-methyltransferase 1